MYFVVSWITLSTGMIAMPPRRDYTLIRLEPLTPSHVIGGIRRVMHSLIRFQPASGSRSGYFERLTLTSLTSSFLDVPCRVSRLWSGWKFLQSSSRRMRRWEGPACSVAPEWWLARCAFPKSLGNRDCDTLNASDMGRIFFHFKIAFSRRLKYLYLTIFFWNFGFWLYFFNIYLLII